MAQRREFLVGDLLDHQIPAIPFFAEASDVHAAGREGELDGDVQTQRCIRADLRINRDGLITRARHVRTTKQAKRGCTAPPGAANPMPAVRKKGAGRRLAFPARCGNF
jgi:hypothetical protein